MRVVITAGGTAGHIHPAIAIADEIYSHEPDSEIVFIGRKDGMEKRIIQRSNYRIYEIDVHGFMRKINLKNILFNIRSILKIFPAIRASKKVFKEVNPDIVIGCGGYVSGPVIKAAAKLKIKTVIQEQNSYPGITTKLLEKHVDIVFCPDDDSLTHLKYSKKAIVVGNPVKKEYFTADREKLRNEYNIGDRAFVLSYGGSNGSKGLNGVVAAFMAKHYMSNKVFHVHATGEYAKESFNELMQHYDVDYENCDNILVFEYISDMADYFAACDLLISRAGALTLAELRAVGRASILIPSPNVTENHQLYNALSIAKDDAAYVYEEGSIDNDELAVKIMELIEDKERLKQMGVNAKKSFSKDAALTIYTNIRALLDRE